MLLYTSFQNVVFIFGTLQTFQNPNYYAGCSVSNESGKSCSYNSDETLVIRLKLRDLDLADRYSVTRATIFNIVNIIISAFA